MARWPQIDGRERASLTWASSHVTATRTAAGAGSVLTRGSRAEADRRGVSIALDRADGRFRSYARRLMGRYPCQGRSLT